jgi:hypothetical protein
MADRIINLICRKCGEKGTVTLAEDDGWPISTSDTFYLAVPAGIIGMPNIMCMKCKTHRPYRL